MRKAIFTTVLFFIVALSQAQNCDCQNDFFAESNLKFSDLTDVEKEEAIQALVAGSCHYKGIKLWGKVQFVNSFPDFKIQFVESFPDIKVKFVTSFPDNCGLWQTTESFPDFKVQVVNSFPDVKVKIVESFPGVD